MASMVSNAVLWSSLARIVMTMGRSQAKPQPSAELPAVTVEQAERLAPEWGRVESRRTGGLGRPIVPDWPMRPV